MRNAFEIFVLEMRALFSNTVTTLIALGLVLLPSLFAWFNLLACWDVFDNMDHLTIAVANSDESYTSDLFPLEINIGEQVVSSLRENENGLHWVSTSEEEAIEGAKSGKYYAAVVIPKGFTESLLTFYEGGAESAKLTYYENEKVNAIAPKLTMQGADSVSYLVDSAFSRSIAEVSLNVMGSLESYLQSANAEGAVIALANRMADVSDGLDRSVTALNLYATVLGSSRAIADSSVTLIGHTRKAAAGELESLEEAKSKASSSTQDLLTSVDQVQASLDATIAALEALRDKVLNDADAPGSVDPQHYRLLASDVQAQIDSYNELIEKMGESKDADQDVLDNLKKATAGLEDTRDALLRSAQEAEAGLDVNKEDVKRRVEEAVAALKALKAHYETELKPQFSTLLSNSQALFAHTGESAAAIDDAAARVSDSVSDLGTSLGKAQGKVEGLASSLAHSSEKLRTLSNEVKEALSSGDTSLISKLLRLDANELAQTFVSPVSIERHAVFPTQGFGSSMTPLYSVLALFIGALLLMVCIRPSFSPKVREALGPKVKLRAYEEFLGHFGIVSVLACAQSMLLAAGNLLFLEVQAVNPALFVFCYWFAGQVFAFISYALVSAFDNLGKGLMVIILIMQVTGCGGSYPMQLLPTFVQKLSPYLPATHVVNAMRAAMFGVYENDYWIALGKLALFLIPAAILGFFLRKPIGRFMEWYLKRVKSSKIVK